MMSNPGTPYTRMSISQKMRAVKEQFLVPGSVALALTPGSLTTIVSSGVVVCLWDPVAGLGGMAHFVMPEGVSGMRCCGPALEKLSAELVRLGAEHSRLAARLYGGCRTVVGGVSVGPCLGELNRQAAESWLKSRGIAIVGGDCGGTSALRVVFSPLNGHTRVEPAFVPGSQTMRAAGGAT